MDRLMDGVFVAPTLELLTPKQLDLLQEVMGPTGAFLACCMFLSSIPVMLDIKKRNGIGEYSAFPYVVQVCNCALWDVYSLADYQGGKMFWPLFCNAVGLVIASASFLCFL